MSTPTQFTPEQIKPLLDPLNAKITERAKRLAADLAADREDKNAANVLCKMAGMPELYKVDGPLEGTGTPPPTPLKFRVDQFVGLELSEAVTAYLEARKASGTVEGPATIDEIYDGLLAGGYKFGGTTENPANHKRAMNIALTRNTAQMHKINENTFALRRWYGMRAARKMAPTSMGGLRTDSQPTAAQTVPDEDWTTPPAPDGAAK